MRILLRGFSPLAASVASNLGFQPASPGSQKKQYTFCHGSLQEQRTRVVCIGDLHGNVDAAKRLWNHLRVALGTEGLAEATVVFLGDYCDRGSNTREVIDWLLALELERSAGKTVFIAGNHDLGMAAFLGCLPIDVSHPDLESTRVDNFSSGFWPYSVQGGMHYVGRRWAGSTRYDCEQTFASYGCPWEPHDERLRDNFSLLVPWDHKDFLRRLKWLHEQDVLWKPGHVICVHAGLVADKSAIEQLEALRARDLAAPILYAGNDPGLIAAFSSRSTVRPMHPELKNRAVLVSGHHGLSEIIGDRIIVDRSGGYVSEDRPLEAIILPERLVVASEKRSVE